MAALISHPLLCPRSSYLPFYPSPPSSAPLSLRLRSRQLRCCLSVKQQANKQAPTTPNDDASTLRVAFAAGGTGGHISPALAIADELRIANPSVQILFLGTSDRLESAAIPSAGYAFASFPAPSLFRPFVSLQNLLLPVHLIKSLIQCHKKLLEFKPHVVVGTGGYVSFPVCLAAAMNGIKLVIQEQNSVPGIANWILSFLAEVIFVAFNSTTDCFPRKNKCVVCGNPVRLTLKQFVPKPVARSRFFPRSGKAGNSEGKVLLVLGGSLGANAINIAMLNLYYQMLMENEKLFIIWQTGVESFNEMESLVKNHPRLHLTPFMHSMDLAYAAADLIVSRAGAMTCYEILATGKPCILIPSPDVAEGHQFKNASLMADLAGSKVLTEDELDSTTLAIAIEEILGDENKMADLSERALKVARPNAAAEIAQQILSLVNVPTEKGRH